MNLDAAQLARCSEVHGSQSNTSVADGALTLVLTDMTATKAGELSAAPVDASGRHGQVCISMLRHTSEETENMTISLAGRAPYIFSAYGGRAKPGKDAASREALERAHMQTVLCTDCESLVDLQAARAAARRRGSCTLAADDGCYSCSRHGRPTRWAKSQRAMAEAVLSGRRIIVERPATAQARMAQRKLPLEEAWAHARWVMSCLA